MQKEKVSLSIVIPVYNEEESLPRFHQELSQVLDKLEEKSEIIYINDGSRDRSQEILTKIKEEDPRVTVIEFRRNFGQTAAMSAGFDRAQGEVIITLDADLQNDPRDIPLFLQKINEGYDLVSGWRKKRQDTFLTRKIPSRIANGLISRLTGVSLHDYGCSLKAYRREVIKNIRLYGDMHRFIPALASLVGARITEIEVRHHPRRFGRSKYGLSRTIKVILDLITLFFLLRFLTKPMRFFGSLGLLALISGFILGLYLSLLKIISGASIGGRPLLLLAVLLIVSGIQLVALGLLGELLARIYFESQAKPIYNVRENND